MTASAPYTLPNGLAIRQHRPWETDFVYREVFVEQVYTRDFPALPANACVIDVGANIGLFSLFIKGKYPQASLFAFEPAPELYALAGQNLAGRDGIHLFPQGLGAAAGTALFTFYPNYSLLSGFHGNVITDKLLLGAGILQQLQHKDNADTYVELLVADKLDNARQFPCEITTLSTVIAQQQIAQIDLLKIDAEKAELDVLHGIADNDWKKIRNIVVEAHSREQAQAVIALLRSHNFTCCETLTANFRDTDIFLITAQRPR